MEIKLVKQKTIPGQGIVKDIKITPRNGVLRGDVLKREHDALVRRAVARGLNVKTKVVVTNGANSYTIKRLDQREFDEEFLYDYFHNRARNPDKFLEFEYAHIILYLEP